MTSSLQNAGRKAHSIPRKILRLVRNQTILPTLLLKNHGPKFAARLMKNQVNRRWMRQPCVALHFIVELARAPAGVARKHFDFFGGGKRISKFHQVIE